LLIQIPSSPHPLHIHLPLIHLSSYLYLFI
jgi:hypothetical protein